MLKDTTRKLSEKLELPYTGKEQDWDIEMANFKRVDEFIMYYIHNDLTEEEKVLLMSLILASYDELLVTYNIEVDFRWDEIEKILNSEKKIFSGLLDYWKGGPLNDRFAIASLLYKMSKKV